ncbi:MAG: hypothetical protein EA381_16420 [Planctomycetaceae bacterium]|nr:MAG: hypothetical protein EA381_16420 [Planctomycetaceae bacterium]
MKPPEFLDRLDSLLVPHDYRKRITKNVPDTWRFYRKGAYIFAAVPYAEVPQGDHGNSYVKTKVRQIVFSLPLIAEKGLFLLHYGPTAEWEPHKAKHKVDKTALRPIIMQAIHFVDPESGANYNSQTAWGPIKFGFCTKVIKKIEGICNNLQTDTKQ